MISLLQVKVLYVRNLTQYCSEEKLREAFEQYGRVERVKRIKDYAFVHFDDRQEAIRVSEKSIGTYLPIITNFYLSSPKVRQHDVAMTKLVMTKLNI